MNLNYAFLANNSTLRLYSALVLMSLALGSTFAGGLWFDFFWLLASGAILWEWGRLIGGHAQLFRFLAGFFVLCALSLWQENYCQGHVPPFLLLFLSINLFIFISLGLSLKHQLAFWNVLGLFYAGSLLWATKFLYMCTLLDGVTLLLFLFAVVWSTDTGAYISGRWIGGLKLCPSLSPSKTWSGFFGGLVFGTLTGVLLLAFLPISPLQESDSPVFLGSFSLPLSLFVSFLTQGGDLLESALKRRFGAKDSGALIPGHGGVMDRLDGFILASFFLANLYLLLFPIYP